MKRPQIGGPAPKRSTSSRSTPNAPVRPKDAKKPTTTRKQSNVVAFRSKSAPQQKAVLRSPFASKANRSSGKFTNSLSKRLNRSVSQAIDARKRFSQYSRNRRIVSYSILGSLSALLLLVFACIFTPIIAVQKVEVTGLDRVNEKQVMAILKKQIGLPLPQVNQQEIAKSLSSFTLIDSVAAIAKPPHTLQVAITERQPICIVKVGGVNYLYDAAGVRIDSARLSDKYPVISIVGDPKQSASFGEAIDVLLALPASLLGRIAEIDAKSKDDVTMRLRGYAGQKILWGDSSQAVLKSKVLAALIKNQKQSDRVTFDVSSPTAPIVRYQ